MANKQIGATLVLSAGNFFTNVKKASSGINELKSNFDKNSSSANKNNKSLFELGLGLGSIAKKAVAAAGAYVGFNQAKDFLADCVTGVQELERANNRLSTLMLNTQGNTQAMVNDIINYADELELMTTIEGDATVAGASQLATFQLQGDTIKQLLPSLQNLAASQYGVNVTQDNMISSANLLGKVMMGSTGALTKAGVNFSETQEKILKTGTEAEKTATLIEVLGQNFGGLAESMAQTDEGKIIQLRNAWGSVKDEVGFALAPVVAQFVDYLHSNIPNIRDKVTNAIETIKPIAEDVINGIKSGCELAGNAVKFVVDNWGGIAPVLVPVIAAILTYKGIMLAINTVEKISLGISAAKKAFMLADGAVVAAYTAVHWGLSAGYGAATAAQMGLNEAMKANPIGTIITIIAVLIAIIGLVVKNWDKLKAAGVTCLEAIKTGISAFVGWIGSVWEGIMSGAVVCWEWVTNSASTAVQWISTAWISVKDGICNAFSVVGSFVKSVWDGVVSTIKGAINSVIGGINKMLSGAVSGINKLISKVNSVGTAVGLPAIPELSAPQIPMLAKGGIIRHMGQVIVGEKGPEMLTLPTGARVTPLPASNSVPNGNTYHNTFYVEVNAADDSVAEKFVKRVKEILDNM